MKSFIRWAGSKKLILKHLIKHCPPSFNRYIEPFCGSGSLFFELMPKRAILSDINRELIVTLSCIKTNVNSVVKQLRALSSGEDEYYLLRAKNTLKRSDSYIAARFIYLNHFCFNGLYRTNKRGEFNVPFSKFQIDKPLKIDDIRSASIALKNTLIYEGDFEKIIKKAKPGDFVYLDPPYVSQFENTFQEYFPNTFRLNDLARLEKSLVFLNENEVKFLVSYSDVPEAQKLFSKWNYHRIWVQRNIAGFSSHQKGAFELVCTNYDRP